MELNLGDKKITIRKWKGKDKKNFINSLKKANIDQNEIMQALVYSCVEENVTLSQDEFKYVLSRIRAVSLGEKISIEFYCDACGNVQAQEFNLKDVIRYTHKPLSEIAVGDLRIKLGEIRSREVYLQKIEEDPNYDFLLRIEEINGDDAFTLEDLEKKFDDLDLDVLTEVMAKFNESRFKIDDINVVKCKCGKEQTYQFDELPGFLPESWFVDE